MSFIENSNHSQSQTFDIVVKMFIEFRNRGVSLSALDLDILNQWENNSLSPQFICQVMLDMYAESQKNGKKFPVSFLRIAHRIEKILIKMRNT